MNNHFNAKLNESKKISHFWAVLDYLSNSSKNSRLILTIHQDGLLISHKQNPETICKTVFSLSRLFFDDFAFTKDKRISQLDFCFENIKQMSKLLSLFKGKLIDKKLQCEFVSGWKPEL